MTPKFVRGHTNAFWKSAVQIALSYPRGFTDTPCWWMKGKFFQWQQNKNRLNSAGKNCYIGVLFIFHCKECDIGAQSFVSSIFEFFN